MELTESNGITHRKNQAGRESVSSIIENSAQSTSLLNESARKGVRVVHSIDPDSCDFEPLMQSINGAALTDLQNIDLSGSETYSYPIRCASLRNAVCSLRIVRSSHGDPNHTKHIFWAKRQKSWKGPMAFPSSLLVGRRPQGKIKNQKLHCLWYFDMLGNVL